MSFQGAVVWTIRAGNPVDGKVGVGNPDGQASCLKSKGSFGRPKGSDMVSNERDTEEGVEWCIGLLSLPCT